MTERAPSDFFAPCNDLSLIHALYRSADPEVRDEGLRLADQNCRNAGHRPVRTLDNADKTNRETTDAR